MNKKDIQPIVFSAIALLLLTVAIAFTAVAVGFTIKERIKDRTDVSSAPPPEEISIGQVSALPNVEYNGDWVLTYGSKKIKAENILFLTDSAFSGVSDCPSFDESRANGRILAGMSGSISLANVLSHHLTDGSDSSGKTLSALLTEKQPAVLFVLLGSDVTESTDEKSFALAYKALLDTVTSASPETAIVCSSLLPSTASEGKERGENIQKINALIYDISGEYHEKSGKVSFFDCYHLFIGEDCFLLPSYQSGSGLSSEGYALLLEELTNCALPR